MAASNPANIIPAIAGGFIQGAPGKDGKDGLSAYEIAQEHGFTGTEAEWLQSIAGANGLSAYEIAVQNGYVGPVLDWLDSLIGPPGVNGNDGKDGKNGTEGKSAYRIAVDKGFDGTMQDWLDSLHQPIEGDIPVIPITSRDYALLPPKKKQSRTLWIITDAKPKPIIAYTFEHGLLSTTEGNTVKVSVDAAADFDGDNTRPIQARIVKALTDVLYEALGETNKQIDQTNQNLSDTNDRITDLTKTVDDLTEVVNGNSQDIINTNESLATVASTLNDTIDSLVSLGDVVNTHADDLTDIHATLTTMQGEIDAFDDVLGNILSQLIAI